MIVTASNAAGGKSATSAATAAIVARATRGHRAARDLGTAQAGQGLSASPALGGQRTVLLYDQWQSCNSAGEGCSNISAASGASYVPTQGNLGSTLRVIVTVKNSVGQEAATSPPSAVVAGKPPSNGQPPRIAGAARRPDPHREPRRLDGAEPISYSYQWQRCTTQPLGSGGTGNGQFEQPSDVAVDASGDLWVVDTGNSRIEEFNERGEMSTRLGRLRLRAAQRTRCSGDHAGRRYLGRGHRQRPCRGVAEVGSTSRRSTRRKEKPTTWKNRKGSG